jgi:hypothetical protein
VIAREAVSQGLRVVSTPPFGNEANSAARGGSAMSQQATPSSQQPGHDELAALRRELATVHARLDRVTRRPVRRRLFARFAPLGIVALLVALMPLSLLAANPFTDLVSGSPHNTDIDLIYNAGITKGCDPPTFVNYCPEGLVTRQEMASFLARTAGLGANPPVTNAAQLGGKPASAYLPSTGDLTMRYSFYDITSQATQLTFARVDGPTVNVTTSAAGGFFMRVPLDRPTGAFGTNLALVSAEICYTVSAVGAKIDSTDLRFGDRGQQALIVSNTTDRTSTTAECYSVAPASVATFSGALYIELNIDFTATTQTVSLHSITLSLRPTSAGAAEAGEFPAAPAAPVGDTE